MANKLNYSLAASQAKLNALNAVINAGGGAGTLTFYDGTKPGSPDTAVTTQNPLAVFTLSATPFGTADSSTPPKITANTIANCTGASPGGQPTWFRVKTSTGAGVIDGTAGTSGCDATIGTITAGQPVQLSSFTITAAALIP